jgi:hypothetical protein
MDQLRLRREHLRRMVEAGMATGPMTSADLLVMEDLGTRMGLAAADADEVVQEAIEESAGICPHCGQPMRARQGAG